MIVMQVSTEQDSTVCSVGYKQVCFAINTINIGKHWKNSNTLGEKKHPTDLKTEGVPAFFGGFSTDFPRISMG